MTRVLVKVNVLLFALMLIMIAKGQIDRNGLPEPVKVLFGLSSSGSTPVIKGNLLAD